MRSPSRKSSRLNPLSVIEMTEPGSVPHVSMASETQLKHEAEQSAADMSECKCDPIESNLLYATRSTKAGERNEDGNGNDNLAEKNLRGKSAMFTERNNSPDSRRGKSEQCKDAVSSDVIKKQITHTRGETKKKDCHAFSNSTCIVNCFS